MGQLVVFVLIQCFMLLHAKRPNPPRWPSSVRVFSPTDTDIEQVVNTAYRTNGGHVPPDNGQFSDARYAFLFKPGTYSADVPVGYYTQVVGLGDSPDDVVFTGPKGVHSEEGNYRFVVGALNSFWRSAENFKSVSTYPWFPGYNGMLWAVSQAAPLRRVHVQTSLLLFQYTFGDAAGFASGGFMANSRVDGPVFSGSQQQWMTRNCQVGSWTGAVWNMVFVGVEGAPRAHCGVQGKATVVEERTPVVAEKPYITIGTDGRFFLNIPAVKRGTSGFDWAPGVRVPFEDVYVADSATDTAATINEQLANGLHVVFAPGVYQLDAALHITHDHQVYLRCASGLPRASRPGHCTVVTRTTTPQEVLLGLGLATLVSAKGNAVVHVDSSRAGVRVAGLLLEAGPLPTDVLLQWGSSSTATSPSADAGPGVISDVFARVGGSSRQLTQADVMVRIADANVVVDNAWLWRADHDVKGLVYNRTNPCKVGLQVEGAHVTAYGLAVEHTLEDQVQWTGEDGQVFFFQAELPYDVTQQEFGDAGYAGYRVCLHCLPPCPCCDALAYPWASPASSPRQGEGFPCATESHS